LALKLSLVITLQCCNAHIELIFSSFQILNMSLKITIVSLQELVRLDFSPISSDYSITNAVTHLDQLVVLTVFSLNFLKL
jgi:hypothetical protein